MSLSSKTSRFVSLLVVMALLMTLVVQMPVKAAPAAYFTFPAYSSTPDGAKSNPVNSNIISEFRATFSQTVPTTLSYTVQQMVLDSGNQWVENGTPSQYPNATPVKSGPTGQEFTLSNVQLFVGMNKITITTPNGVEGICYVYYDNAPVIHSITINDGVPLNSTSPVYVNNATQFFIIQTENADAVSVNGVNATAYGQNSFSISNFALTPGLNTLIIQATSNTRLYEIKRSIIYIDGPGAMYNVFMQSDANNAANDAVQIDGGNVVSSANGLPLGLKGEIAIPASSGIDPAMQFTQIDLIRDNVGVFSIPTSDPQLAGKITISTPVDDGRGHKIYTYFIDLSAVTASAGWPINTNGTYRFTLNGDYYDGGTQRQPFSSMVSFTYKDSSKASIANVQQIFGVDPSNNTGGTAGYFSSSISNLPIYALVSVQNNAGDFTPSVSVTQDGVTKTLVSGTDYVVFDPNTTPGQGSKKIRINSLPFTGSMTLNFSIQDGSNIDNYLPISINYTPVPSIVLYGIYDGDNYTLPTLPNFTGKLFNFVTNAEKQSIVVRVNGIAVHANIDITNSTFSVVNADSTNPNQLTNILAQGPNEVVVSGTAQGIPVETRITVYYYTDDAPDIKKPYPVPVVTTGTKNISDPDQKFVQDASVTDTYNTTEKTADILIGTADTDKLIVMLDGEQFFVISFNSDGSIQTPLPMTVDGIQITTESRLPGYFRITNLPLNMGANSIVVKATKGPVSTSVPLTVVRSNAPYQILSPVLPQERVINQNFLKVEISAEGADSVIVGKDTVLEKVTENNTEYFTGTIYDLKKGSNTIEYTIIIGENEIEDEFEVVYANSNTIGAQYSEQIGSRGKIDMFNKAVSIQFPKGTMLTPVNDTTQKVELFDSQRVLAGIADPVDGRTKKTVSHLGSISEIHTMGNFMSSMLTVPYHFGYASNLYWIDAGYYDSTQPGYVQQNGMHPYYGQELQITNPNGNNTTYNIWNRQGNYWLKPTVRGTITLQYDSNIRDVAANQLSIWRFGYDQDARSMKWTNIGGKVNAKSHTITASMDQFGYYAVFYNNFGFDDTQNHGFARDDMEIVFAKGIMNSKSGGEFGAYEPTTRGEFAQALVKVLDIPLDYDPNNRLFYDVPPYIYASPYWDYRYIETAGQNGFVRGVGIQQFAPDSPVTREQAAIMIAYAMNLKMNTNYDAAKTKLDKVFTDSGTINYYARAAVEAVYSKKLMQGKLVPNSDPEQDPLLIFDPTARITRAETAKLLVNLMRANKLL
ncbi:S-layer homology domain-containing protein [Marinicrinis lubricantis]|uniref:S-layer homology domain-containing protein n=1 Tax=Marinicrinis lubricantis TaxID=2086470 RepID=A0ABW1IKA8_9BACL